MNGPLRGLDERLGDALRTAAPPARLAELLADIGNVEVALPLLAAAMALAYLRMGTRVWWSALCYAVTTGVMAAVVSALKGWTDGTGPLGGTGFYPSGHAATTAVALGAAALLVGHQLSRHAWLFLWSAVALLTAGNGLGLVWRGYHWPLDVVTSWCLSVLLLSLATAAARRAPPLSGRRRSTERDRG